MSTHEEDIVLAEQGDQDTNFESNDDQELTDDDLDGSYEGVLNASKDHRIVLDKADRSLYEFNRWHKEDQIIIDPEWQRNYVWDAGRASKLIESFLLDIPVPVVYLSKTADNRYEVIDGLQRLTSVFKYFDNGFHLRKLDVLRGYPVTNA